MYVVQDKAEMIRHSSCLSISYCLVQLALLNLLSSMEITCKILQLSFFSWTVGTQLAAETSVKEQTFLEVKHWKTEPRFPCRLGSKLIHISPYLLHISVIWYNYNFQYIKKNIYNSLGGSSNFSYHTYITKFW